MRLSPQGVRQGWVAVCKLGWLCLFGPAIAVGGRGRWCPVMGGLGFWGGGVSVSRRQSRMSGCSGLQGTVEPGRNLTCKVLDQTRDRGREAGENER